MNWLSLCLKNSYQLTNNNYESFLGIMRLTYCFVTFFFVNLALCVVVLLYLFNMCVILFNFSPSVIIKISSFIFSAVLLSLWHILFLCRLSVCMRVQVMLHVCVLRAGRVMAQCVWRSTTVSWRVEEAAAPTRTVTTSDPDRSVLKICDRINFWILNLNFQLHILILVLRYRSSV